MGITERKEREKEDLHKSILNAAREVFLEKGYDGTSIRNIAEKIEYSPTTIYLYFKDKDAVFHALHTEGFNMLNEKMSVLQHVADPFERLMAMGRIYMAFAKENKELYDLMFLQNAPINFIEEDDQVWQEGQSAFAALVHTIEECNQKGYFNFPDAEIASYVIWSTLHGMCALETRARCKKVISSDKKERINELGFDCFNAMLESMKSGM